MISAFPDLSADEVQLLADYLFDRLTQRELADKLAVAQTTISYRLHRAAQKLRDRGLVVRFPGRGRRMTRIPTAMVEPEALDRLIVTQRPDGSRIGRWVDS